MEVISLVLLLSTAVKCMMGGGNLENNKGKQRIAEDEVNETDFESEEIFALCQNANQPPLPQFCENHLKEETGEASTSVKPVPNDNKPNPNDQNEQINGDDAIIGEFLVQNHFEREKRILAILKTIKQWLKESQKFVMEMEANILGAPEKITTRAVAKRKKCEEEWQKHEQKMAQKKRKIAEFGRAIDTAFFGLQMSRAPLPNVQLNISELNFENLVKNNAVLFACTLLKLSPDNPPVYDQMQGNLEMAFQMASSENENGNAYLNAINRQLMHLLSALRGNSLYAINNDSENSNLKFYMDFYGHLNLLLKEQFAKSEMKQKASKMFQANWTKIMTFFEIIHSEFKTIYEKGIEWGFKLTTALNC